MDFKDNQEEAAFREEARQWLNANKPTDEELEGLNAVQRAQLWQKRKFDANWACIEWPESCGGRGGSTMDGVIFKQEEAKVIQFFDDLKTFSIGHGMVGPTLMSTGSEEEINRFVPRIASGEDIWCQLFSEPAAGSDLAALRTKAVKDGDDWVINGQKIWTSGAQHSNWGILVVRTDPTLPKHKGLTYFYVDMHSQGIECKPIKQISGDSEFNEVYFTDVRIPDRQRLGEVGDGWKISLTTLMHERAGTLSRGGMPLVLSRKGKFGFFDSLKALAESVYVDDDLAINDSYVRAKLASWFVQESGLRFTSYRTLSAVSRGATPGPEASIGKLLGAANCQDMASFAIELQEQDGVVRQEGYNELVGSLFQELYMEAPGGRIAGGTDEIMLNIIAEQVLGLPQEPRVDKGIPFNQVPSGA